MGTGTRLLTRATRTLLAHAGVRRRAGPEAAGDRPELGGPPEAGCPLPSPGGCGRGQAGLRPRVPMSPTLPVLLTVSPLCPGCPGSPSLPGGPWRKRQRGVPFSSETHVPSRFHDKPGDKKHHFVSEKVPARVTVTKCCVGSQHLCVTSRAHTAFLSATPHPPGRH